MNPKQRYQYDRQAKGFQHDPAQELAIDHLQRLYHELIDAQPFYLARKNSVLRFLDVIARAIGVSKTPAVKGVYFWGGVGRGKTYLMDIFFETLPFDAKMRTHFHRFMRRVHHELTALKDTQDPLERVADILSDEAQVICFDEFFVVDITDAMILAGLLKALFARGVVLVATSNIEPSGLYVEGLQRARFLPAIDLLNQEMEVVNVDGGFDYRLRTLAQAQLYYSPCNDAAHVGLGLFFDRVVRDKDAAKTHCDIAVEGRSIRALKEADDVVWFDFFAVCDGPRSQNDYIELAREYHAVIVEGVPLFDGRNDDQARRFIYLVDEFYDRQVKLILSAAEPIHSLYRSGRLSFEFQRTVSRVQEMQSKDYLAKAHRP